MRKVALTTTDNPYDPIIQFDDWYAYDEQMDYHSCSLLARFCRNSSIEHTKEEEDAIIEEAIDRIVELNPIGLYKKVVRE